MSDPERPASVTGRRAVVLWALLAAALSLGRHLPFASDRFENGFEASIGGRFQAAIQKAWDRGGFFRMRGRPLLTPVPTDPPSGRTYANHPPLNHWMVRLAVHLFGMSEWGVRLYPTLCCAVTAALLAAIAARLFGHAGAATAAAVFASSPMAFFYGRMANYESPILMLTLAALWLLPIEGVRPRRLALAAALFVIAVWHDWAGAFPLAGALVFRVAARRPLWIRPLLRIGLAIAGAVAAYLVLLSVWEGGPAAAWGRLTGAAELAASDAPYTLPSFLRAQGAHLVGLFGWPAALLQAGALVWAATRVFRGGSVLGGHIACWTAVSLINVILFRNRAFNHEFWWYYQLPAVTLASAGLAAWAWARWRPLAAALAIALVVGAALPLRVQHRRESEGRHRSVAQTINRLADERTLLVTPYDPGSWYFYAHPWVRDGNFGGDEIERLDRQFRRGELTVDRFLTIVPYGDEATRAAIVQRAEQESFEVHALAPGVLVLELRR